MTEAELWDETQRLLSGMWHGQRHEDKHSRGIPDVSFGIGRTVEGWIELKQLPKLPGPTDRFDFDLSYFTPQQRNWMRLRAQHGTGKLYVYLCTPSTRLLWPWKRLDGMLGHDQWADIEAAAIAVWQGTPPALELASALKTGKTIPRRFKLNGG